MIEKNNITAQFSGAKQQLLERLLQGKAQQTSKSNVLHSLPQIVPDLEGRYQPFPLTEMQQAYWLGRGDVFDLGNVSMHHYIELDGKDLEIEKFNFAWNKLVKHHEMMRAVVLANGQQQILAEVPSYEIQIIDLREQDEQTINSQLQEIRDRLSHQVLPLDQWPQFEIVATQYSDRHFRLHISLDSWCVDYWSSIKLFQDLSHFYNQPDQPLPNLEISFRDYVLATLSLKDSPSYQRSLDYWLQRIPTLPPAPELPLAKNPHSVVNPQFKRLQATIDCSTWQQLKQRGSQVNLTATGVLLAAYAEVLTLWSKQPRFTINVPSFNRLPVHPQVNEIIGECASFTLLEIDNTREESFVARAQRIQNQLWEDLEHEYVSGVRVLREWNRVQEKAGAGTMPIVFTHGPQADENNPLAIALIEEQTEIIYSISQTPQVWLDNQYSVKADGSLSFNWDFVEGLFPPNMIEDMFDAYCRLLKLLANQPTAWQQSTLPLLPPTQLKQRTEINSNYRPLSSDLLHTLFTAQVPQRPNQAAIITSNYSLTYEELSHRVHYLGHQLRGLGATPNQLVAVVMEKGWEQIVAVLGILAAGAAYVPIDPALPPERQSKLLALCQVKIIITQAHLNHSLTWPSGVQRLVVDKSEVPTNLQSLTPVQKPEDLAYIIYTSGSTGEPKGVMIDHRGAVNTIIDINQRFRVNPQDRVLALSSLSFDLSVYDIFGTLAAGGTIVIPDHAASKDPAHWAELITTQQVTVWNSVPALMQMLVEYATNRNDCVLDSLRLVLLSGDWIPLSLPERIQTLVKDVELISLGGATEASIWSIFSPIPVGEGQLQSIPYGLPLTNQQFYVLNSALAAVPVWVPGQLYIGGIGLAQGYWQNPEKTAVSFITHPVTGERLYRTGDLGRYLPSGEIELIGREDAQVKVRGYRIELGEIETVIKQHPEIQDVAIAAVGEQHGNKQLVAYIVPKPQASTLFTREGKDPLETLPLWETVVQAGQKQAQQTLDWVDVSTFATGWELLERVYANSVRVAFNKLGVFSKVGEQYSIDSLMEKCQIKPRYCKWLARALKSLVDVGLLQQQGKIFSNVFPLPTEPLSTVLADITAEEWQKFGFTPAMVKSLVSTAEQLANILTENLHSAQIYAAEETSEIYQRLFEYCNAIARELTQAITQSWLPKGQLRILEVGAGIGSTTSHLLPVLSPDRTTYFYTDISQYFLQLAQEKFAAYLFLNTGILNIEADPQSQGYEPHSFDLIIASSVLHVARDIKSTLRYLRSLLSPNGLLLLIEETQFHRPFDLGMGLQQGFDRFEDEDLRQNHPLLSREQWQTILTSAGFVNSAIFTQPDSVPNFLGFDVLLAQAPAFVQKFQSQELQKFIKQKLPEYMIPYTYHVLETLPLTANGKVNRQALSAIKSIQPERSKTFIAPQNPLEITIAEIWSKILKLEKIGTQDNFFDLGGDSLIATQVHQQLREKLSQDFPLVKIFEYPNISSLAKYLSNQETETQTVQQSSERGEKRKAAAQEKRRRYKENSN
ncbi:MAG TPA: amino acid adenylation domain-containing protein [Nostocaceae cyanobacterium]|nr:amino acid adenylation domain-containing protein [Nostocaceae cyanobacterium]